MSQYFAFRRAALCAPLSFATLLFVGCSDDGTVTAAGSNTPLVRGNWQISSAAAAASRLSVLSGALSAENGKITALVHTQAAGACSTPGTAITLAGAEDDQGRVTLSGPLADGTLTVSGTLAADGRSLDNASYSVKGGTCALPEAVPATVQNFAPVTGTYAGNFADGAGQVAQVTADFSQSSTPDANGNFTLAGAASVSNNPCFPATVPIAKTQVTGDTFTFTYATGENSVTATGTFSQDAGMLTVTSWSLTGTCGPDTGVASTMTRQSS